ncbi:MAG: DUF2520 domain-containing protein [Muribaculaceae bacterium]|nr:DUF2520 domain-containing protein [Muribaculaceae bacterium]
MGKSSHRTLAIGSDTRVVLIGAGNVATSLALALCSKCHLVQIYSRTLGHAKELADKCGCENATCDLTALADADVYIVSVTDDAIAPVLKVASGNRKALWLHTSGSTPIGVFGLERPMHGVLYPMQSFSRELVAKMDEVHFFVEGSTDEATTRTEELARAMSQHVHRANSSQRESLHMAAVFACNFANHMFAQADDLLANEDLPFEAMLPLIRNMVAKLEYLSPADSQTGPAARGDKAIIERHLSRLEGRQKEIYKLLSQSILEKYAPEPQ